MKRFLPPALLLCAWTAIGSPVRAQAIVHDPVSYASLVQQAQTALNELEQLKSQVTQATRLADGFATNSGVNSLAPSLASPALRAFVPDIDLFMAAAKGDLTALGQIGQQAATIRQANRLYTPAATDAAGQDLEQAGNRAARDLALGQQTTTTGASRLTGLQQLVGALDTAATPRAVLDLQARLTGEQAMIANDQLRLQGMAMTQDAEARVQAQRAQERVAADNAALLALYKSSFQ